MRYLILLAGTAIVVVMSASAWFDEAEVVKLVTFDADAQQFETGLWIVEVGGAPHLRAYSKKSAWLRRLRTKPEVRLTRGGDEHWYRATVVDDDELRDRVTEAMEQKYGRLNDVVEWFRSPSRAVAIRLDPIIPSETASDRTDDVTNDHVKDHVKDHGKDHAVGAFR